MTNMEKNDSPGTILCKSCGLCCTGHLFIWTKLRSAELDNIESLGLKVFREPGQRGFSQPCPLWKGECTIYTSAHFPRFCGTYKCKLLKELHEDTISLGEALTVVQHTLEMVKKVEPHLPVSSAATFRERLVTRLNKGSNDPGFRQIAGALLTYFSERFGVSDFFGMSEDGD